jgi:hypothetical protein
MARKNPAAVALGRRGGKATSPKKAAAARKNAKLGGRTMKFNVGDRVTANDKAPGDYRSRAGTVFEVGPGKSEYGIRFEGAGPLEGYLMSWWLDHRN